MEHCGAEYIGALILSDWGRLSGDVMYRVLLSGQTIEDIGAIEISQTLFGATTAENP